MTELVLMRHGHSLSTKEAGVQSDSQRPLSPLGEREALEAARHLSTSGFAPSLIISSPYIRADRTAEIAAGVFTSASRKTAKALSDGPAQAVMDLLLELAKDGGRVLVVGHQPLMGAMAGYFLGQEGFDLSPAGFVRVNAAEKPGAAALVEFYSPPLPKDGSH
jgi:phosphohistidine phosphatase